MRTTGRFIVVDVCLLTAQPLFAQEDRTPPVLLDFTIVPAVFEAASGNVTHQFCGTTIDNLAGVASLTVDLRSASNGTRLTGGSASTVAGDEFCGAMVVPQFAPLGTYWIAVFIRDRATNGVCYQPAGTTACSGVNAPVADLCSSGVCTVTIVELGGANDADNDGVPEDADNCPNDQNPGQGDRDLDLIGDVCDPFPDDRDNEQAQCELDLATCLATGTPDADGDGEEEPSVILTPHREPVYHRENCVCAPMRKDSPWAMLRLSR